MVKGSDNKEKSMPSHTINGHQINYDVHGEGRPLLLLHSFLCNTQMWEHQIQALSKDHQLVIMDIRGHGQSSPSQPHSIYDLADDAIGLLDALEIQQATWVGLSIGGMISMRAALTHPERVAGLVLLSTDSKSESFLVRVERRVLGQVVKHLGVLPVVIPILRKMFGKTTHHNQPELVRTWRGRFLKVHTESMLNSLAALLHRDDVTAKLQAIRAPTLIIHGEEDRAIPMKLSANLKSAIPHADLKLLSKVGHLATLESPEHVNTYISDFLLKSNL
jgi:pimeloyl-ACP methyl ester carboxylesterase